MKQILAAFILTRAEQRLVIFVVLLLVAFAWLKHQRDLSYESTPRVNSSPAER